MLRVIDVVIDIIILTTISLSALSFPIIIYCLPAVICNVGGHCCFCLHAAQTLEHNMYVYPYIYIIDSVVVGRGVYIVFKRADVGVMFALQRI